MLIFDNNCVYTYIIQVFYLFIIFVMKKIIAICLGLFAFSFAFASTTSFTSKTVEIPTGSTMVSICPVFKDKVVKNNWIVYARVNGIGGWFDTMIRESGAKVNLKGKLFGVKNSDQIVAGECWDIALGTPVVFASDTFAVGRQYTRKTLPTSWKLTYYVSKGQSYLNVNVSFK